MSDYRSNQVPGQTYFFTVRLKDPRATLLTDHISAFGEAIRQARIKRPFHVDAWVAMPSHAHAIWTLPPGDTDCASRWRVVKIAFSKSVRKARKIAAPDSMIWMRHFQQHALHGADDYVQAVDYIHNNPVAHGMCGQPADWPWSSVHRFIADGMIDASLPLLAPPAMAQPPFLLNAP